MERRFTFDDVADLYDGARPDYPDALFDDITAAIGLEANDAVLELGCGTGQATKGFARRGFQIVALDPGPEMIRVAQKHFAVFQNVQFIESTFEAWPSESSAFKIVVAAQSLHWVAPEVRFVKAAAVLAPDGALVVFGNVPMPVESPLREEFESIYARYAPALSGPAPERWYLPSGPIITLFDQSKCFVSPRHKCYPWNRIHTASSYISLLRTLSGHQLLAPAQQEPLFAAITEAIIAHGGQFELPYETHLFVAKKAYN